MTGHTFLFALACALAVSAGCATKVAPARAQLLIVVDTDAHVTGELVSNPNVSPDSAVDVLRVDVLDSAGQASEIRTFLVPDPASWPVSFGVLPPSDAGADVWLRVRIFRALFAASDSQNAMPTLDPPAAVTIERQARIAPPAAGVVQVLVRLAEDCMGTPSSYATPGTTCIDGAHRAADPHEGVVAVEGAPPSAVSRWQPGLAVPCAATPGADQVCIPGGFAILGDFDAVGDGDTQAYEPVPLRPTVLSPFRLDAHEFTVARLRALVRAKGLASAQQPTAMDPADTYNRFCTWLGPDDATNDDLPVNCVSYDAAASACAAVGGALPTEAQWEYAARGRGQRRLYPWGDTTPTCCAASVSRVGPEPSLAECGPASGLQPVGSHPLSPTCSGLGDVTRDGVFDLAGSVSEALRDAFAAYSDPCWSSSPILRDPVCMAPNVPQASRGGYWNSGLSTLLLPLRHSFSDGPAQGFRCAYPGAP